MQNKDHILQKRNHREPEYHPVPESDPVFQVPKLRAVNCTSQLQTQAVSGSYTYNGNEQTVTNSMLRRALAALEQ